MHSFNRINDKICYKIVFVYVIKSNPDNTQSRPMRWSVTSTFYIIQIEFTTFSFEAILFLNFVSIFMSYAGFASQMPNGLFNVERYDVIIIVKLVLVHILCTAAWQQSLVFFTILTVLPVAVVRFRCSGTMCVCLCVCLFDVQ